MSLFGKCELKNLTAEYVEERLAMEAAEVSTEEINTENVEIEESVDLDEELDVVDEAGYIDLLLEALD